MKRRIICYIFAIVFAASILPCASANEANHPSESERNSIVQLVNYVDHEKEMYNLDTVDFSQLCIGNRIYTYEYINGQLEALNYMYPLFYDGNLVAFVNHIENGAFQFSTALVSEINALGDINGISIIYDSNNCYLYDGVELYHLFISTIGIESRGNLAGDSSILNFSNVQIVSLDTYSSLGYIPMQQAYAIDSTNAYYFCDVDTVTQPLGSNICWAACVACIVNYKTGTSYCSTDIAQEYLGSDYDHTLPHMQLCSLLIDYGLDYLYRSSIPSTDTLVNNISNDYPVVGIWIVDGYERSSKTQHDCVIYGIQSSGDYISVMDPEYGKLTAQSQNGETFGYTSPQTGAILRLTQAICHDWYPQF